MVGHEEQHSLVVEVVCLANPGGVLPVLHGQDRGDARGDGGAALQAHEGDAAEGEDVARVVLREKCMKLLQFVQVLETFNAKLKAKSRIFRQTNVFFSNSLHK